MRIDWSSKKVWVGLFALHVLSVAVMMAVLGK